MNATTTHPLGRGRLASGFIAGTAGALVGVLATITLVDRSAIDAQPVSPLGLVPTTIPYSADTADRHQTPHRPVRFPCRPDAESRWQIPDLAVADLPYSADTAERWLTPDFAIAELPYSADTAERLLCAP